MALPEATLDVQDGALGTVPASVANASVVIGVSSKGPINTLTGVSDTNALTSTFGVGPAVEATAARLAVAGGPVYVCRINPSVAGTAGSVTHTGTGSGTVTPSLAPSQTLAVKITTAGAIGTAAFAISLGGAAYTAPVTTVGPAPFVYAVPDTLTTLSFPAGTYNLNDIITFATAGGAGTGATGATPTAASSPLDVYDIDVTIKASGALGTATFTYSLDGGDTQSPTIAVPSGGVYAIPNAGLVLTFAGTFVANDVYAFTTTAAGYSTSDLTTSILAIRANSTAWGFAHVVGAATNAAGAASVAAVLATQADAMAAEYRYAWLLMECPSTESDATIKAAFASFANARVAVGVGDYEHVSPLTGRIDRRNAAWQAGNRAALIPAGEDVGYVGRGALSQVRSLYRDEGTTPGLDEGRFITLRSFIGQAGYYITNGRTMATAGSDYAYLAERRVMDAACRITRAATLPYVNGSVRVNPVTGYVDERDAKRIEAKVNSQLKAGIVATGDASDSSVVVSRSSNILATQTLPVDVRITPLGRTKTIRTTIGFRNPQTQTT